MNGYLHPKYAQSLNHFGKTLELPRCKGWILKRDIPDSNYFDAMGCYPLFSCQNWSELNNDLDNNIEQDIICLSIVTDPFGDFNEEYLKNCFKDRVFHFKDHYITNLSNPLNKIISSHHQRYSQKGLKVITVEECKNPIEVLDEWVYLYTILIERHNIKGIPAFSLSAFEKQLQTPGIVAFKATYKEKIVGILLWYVQKDIAYYHLGAYDDIGYENYASYALFYEAIKFFSDMNLKFLNIGAGAGLKNKNVDGLSEFKRGWSSETRPTYFCGRIFNKKRYLDVIKEKKIPTTEYFPAYRKGEFG